MDTYKKLETHAKKELTKELNKLICRVHNKRPKITKSNLEGAQIECCCPEFEAIVKAQFGD